MSFTTSQPIVLDCSRVYVIGDIHGRSDLLDRMVVQISRDLEMNPVSGSVTITLGDYMDRGPDSRGVLERLARNPFPTDFVALKGNHEALFEAFLQRSHGRRTLATLGRAGDLAFLWHAGRRSDDEHELPTSGNGAPGRGAGRTLQVLGIPENLSHRREIFPLPCRRSSGRSSGMPKCRRPFVIRDEFLKSTVNFGKIVVHGHTPTKRPEVLSNRINIDTGAFATGRLTCAILESSQPRFLMTA